MQSFSEYVSDNLTPVDGKSRYADFLNDCYSFDSIGGPFAYMRPADVLKAMDPTAFRCGVNDYLDGDEFTYFEGDYYDSREFDQAKEEYESELNDQIDYCETEYEEYEELSHTVQHGSELWIAYSHKMDALTKTLAELESLQKALENV